MSNTDDDSPILYGMKDWPMNPAGFFRRFIETNCPHVDVDMEAVTLWEKFCDDNGFILEGIVLDKPVFEICTQIAHAGHAIAVFNPQGIKVFVDIEHIQEKEKQ